MTLDRHACPKCGAQLVLVQYSQRTTPGGTWYEMRCPRCTYHADYFHPRRIKTDS